MTDPADLEDRAIIAALQRAESRGWRALTLPEVAVAAELPLVSLYRVFPTKAHLLAGLIARIDRAMLAGGETDPTDSPRDRLFEVLMRRFDALSAHRAGMVAIMRDLRLEPIGSLFVLSLLQRSMRWALATAGIRAEGPIGFAKVQALVGLYGAVLRVWRGDDSADLARTMAALDRHLRRAEQVAGSLERRDRKPAAAGDDEAAAG